MVEDWLFSDCRIKGARANCERDEPLLRSPGRFGDDKAEIAAACWYSGLEDLPPRTTPEEGGMKSCT